MDLRTVTEASQMLRSRQLSSVQLVRECLDRIEALNPTLNAFITVTADSAMHDAEIADTEIAAGRWLGPLHGIPIGLKDLIDTAHVRTTAGSAVFANRIPSQDAEVVRKLKAAGAVLVGKQNLHEFAYGGSSVISHFGPVRNPVNPDFIAGGSSGGSAAAVAGGMCYASIGTDTAGSVREPAALCGIVGLKPSFGLVSPEGIIALSPSLDQAGPLARSVQDAAIMLDAMTGSSGQYFASLRERVRNFELGVPRTFFYDDLESDVATAVETSIGQFQACGFRVTDVEVRVNNDRTLQAAEAYAFHREMVAAVPQFYHPETLRRILSGKDVTTDQYRAAARELAHIREEIASLFNRVDALITPTTPISPPRLSEFNAHLDRLRPAELVLLRNTRPINVWGLPAISVPCGSTTTGLPIGLQIIGPPHGETTVLQLANAFEQLCAPNLAR
jgi:aspartyl-tRNA(Asn)/glutamyl-tRNA(Gln) amidotransferase subunit A